MTTKANAQTPRRRTTPKPTAGQARPKATAGDSMRRTIELDGVTIELDLAPARNVRLMRRLKREDMEALLEFFDGVFGADQLDMLEDRFNLVDVEDYNAFLQRAMGAVSPN
ncbi:MAG: hypothetical protein Q4F65_01085 [Propionibacteriaceae bacterium]|nr:hypothetical protein [Propionibacteriaceae bacterium]